MDSLRIAPSDHAAAARVPAHSLAQRATPRVQIPRGVRDAVLSIDGCEVRLTHLEKLFWPREGITKADLLQYYADVAPFLLPHLVDRPMTLKRFPEGAGGDFFFMKHAPAVRPAWLAICTVEHSTGTLDYPLVQDLPSLLWAVNLGSIDLNPAYARRGQMDQPDFVHFDLDPVVGASFERVLEAALVLRDALEKLRWPSFVKTTGSRGLHIFVPIQQGPEQPAVWAFAKQLAHAIERRAPELLTTAYRAGARPHGRVLIDYNQNAWGRTLASVYSVRPAARAPVSMPVTWEEIERGVHTDEFRLDTARDRLARLGDLWAPLLAPERRVNLEQLLS